MDDAKVAQVRRFNRAVTKRVGVLDDRYLARGRPLGEARVLWEIGEEGCEVRALRTRLGLDSGHASRLLRSLERAGLVQVTEGQSDRRARTARLTEARPGPGRVEQKFWRIEAAFALEPADPPARPLTVVPALPPDGPRLTRWRGARPGAEHDMAD